jgi:hypothetical protein
VSTVHCYTSITFSYLAKARVLAWSLKRFHSDWIFWVCITDRAPEGFTFDLDQEYFDHVVWGDQLPLNDVKGWLFQHDIIEVCTAVKGPVMEMLTKQSGADKIIYIDPDIAIFNPLDDLLAELDQNDILLTPHQLTPEEQAQAIVDNEITSLQHGIYNLGFVAIRNAGSGKLFAKWWSDRLQEYCYDDIPSGLFVDQRWCDLVPALFENVKILRDPGCNVASWNLSHRKIEITTRGEIIVNGSPLRFFHFTKIFGAGLNMVNKYAQGNIYVFELISWYKKWVQYFTSPQITKSWWHYGKYENGEPILKEHRLLYRNNAELRHQYPNPYGDEEFSFHRWLLDNVKEWKSIFVPDGGTGTGEQQSREILQQFIRRSRWSSQCHKTVQYLIENGIDDIIVYGAGEVGRTLVPIAKANRINIRCAIDRNPLLWGQRIEDVEIVSLQKAMEEEHHTYLIASFAFINEISQLIQSRFRDNEQLPIILTIMQ